MRVNDDSKSILTIRYADFTPLDSAYTRLQEK